jgi:membrane-associated phospholipid phosphatase
MLLRRKKPKFTLFHILLLLVSGGIFTFFTLVRNDKKYAGWDKKWSKFLYDSKFIPNSWMVGFSMLGSGFFMVPLGLMLFLSCRKTGERNKAFLILWNVIGIRILNALLKRLFKRTPPEWERLAGAGKYGYPSEHAMNAAGFYTLLLFLCGKWGSIWANFSTLFLLILIGLSRVKLGIHYLYDVAAGLAGGVFTNILLIKTYKAKNRSEY